MKRDNFVKCRTLLGTDEYVVNFQSKATVVPNGSCKRNSNLTKDGGIPKSSSSYENTPNVDSTELGAAEKGGGEETPDNSQKAAVLSDETEEDSGRGSASTPLAGNFRSRYAIILHNATNLCIFYHFCTRLLRWFEAMFG